MDPLKSLFARIADGDKTAFEEVFTTCRHGLLSYIERLVVDLSTAEDIVQDTFTQLWQKGPSLSEITNPGGWLRDVSCKISINYYRREQRHKRLLRDIGQDVTNACGHEAINFRFLQQLLSKGLEQLPADQRQLVRLHLEQGKGRRQLARELKLSEKSIRSRLEKAWLQLRAFIQKHIGILLPLPLLLAALQAIYQR